AGRPPRHGDGDDGRALVVADPAADRWASLLATGAALFGPLPWWPPTEPDPQSVLLAGLVGRRVPVAGRPAARPDHLPRSGITLLRTPAGTRPEIWCRCDGGPHGFLSIAAHAHADALSVEVRHDGVDVLADPGTYCYHGEPGWRRYFRSTLAHNTVELDGVDQSVPGGPFLWARQARTRLLDVATAGPGPRRWSAEHSGYGRLHPPARHRRTVSLDPGAGTLEILDEVEVEVGGGDGRAGAGDHGGDGHALRLAFHLGPAVEAALTAPGARLRWPARGGGGCHEAVLELPDGLAWEAHRGETAPVLGWYSAGFGRREPSLTLVGSGRSDSANSSGEAGSAGLRTVLRFSR
ncbi:MAG: heparinase II/III family protein, partial [Acidimicrobiales bacterium]